MADDILMAADVLAHKLAERKFRELEKEVKKLYDKDARELHIKNTNLSYANDQLRRQIFDLEQRIQLHVARAGFASLEDAESSQDAQTNPSKLKEELDTGQARIRQLEADVARHVTINRDAYSALEEAKVDITRARDEIDVHVKECERLRGERDTARKLADDNAMKIAGLQHQLREAEKARAAKEAATPTKCGLVSPTKNKENSIPSKPSFKSPLRERTLNSPRSPSKPLFSSPNQTCHRLKRELQGLEKQYDSLLQEKQKLSTKFSDKIKQWKNFKTWFFVDLLDVDDTPRDRSSKKSERTEKRKKLILEKLEALGFPIGREDDEEEGVEIHNDDSPRQRETLSRKNEDPTTELPAPRGTEPSPILLLANSPLIERPPLISSKPIESFSDDNSHPSSTVPPFSPDVFYDATKKPDAIMPTHVPDIALARSLSPADLIVDESGNLQRNILEGHAPELLQSEAIPSAEPSLASTSRYPKAKPPIFSTFSPARQSASNAKFPKSSRKSSGTKAAPFPSADPFLADNHMPKNTVYSANSHAPTEGNKVIRSFDHVLNRPKSEPSGHAHANTPQPEASTSSKILGKRKASLEVIDLDSDEDDDLEDIVLAPRPKSLSPRFKRRHLPISEPAGRVLSKEKEAARLHKLRRLSNSEHMKEHLAYKGRGRYAKPAAPKQKSDDARYEINKNRNDGLGYQYDAVVRSKDARKRLDAGVCECCRDYYEAVGPLPPRLQAPLWKSPSPNRHRKGCKHHQDGQESPSKRSEAIDDHRQEISRHRHNWAPPTTPPGYWNIGFPTTQEAADINRQAEIMAEQKKAYIEGEASKENGKYRRKK